MGEFKCPVCGEYIFSETGIYEDCPVCDWTQDSYQEKFPDRKGANHMSLNEARGRYSAVSAHKYSTQNKKMLESDNKCGCFYCLKIFIPSEIFEWIWDNNVQETAVCPYCGIDSIISESSGYPITKEFLEKMQKIWF